MSQQPKEEDKESTDSQDKTSKVKQVVSDAKEKIEDRLSMAGLLKQGKESLEAFMNPELEVEEQIPVQILSGAKGVIFLTVVKGGVGIGGASIGTGFAIARMDYAQGWSGPCAIGMVGIQWGLNIGVQKTEHIIVLRDDTAVKTLIGKGQLKLGVDASIALGPKGRDAEVALSVNDKGYAPTASYSMSTGAYVGISLEGQVIAIRSDCNKDYYNKEILSAKILDGSESPPKNEDYKSLCKMLDEYAKPKKKSLKDFFTKKKQPKDETKEE